MIDELDDFFLDHRPRLRLSIQNLEGLTDRVSISCEGHDDRPTLPTIPPVSCEHGDSDVICGCPGH